MVNPASVTGVTAHGDRTVVEAAARSEIGEDATARQIPEVEPPLIGHAEAANAIRTGIERAFSLGAVTLVALEGERGSGKSRLLTYAGEIAARMNGDVRILCGSCREGGSDGSYAPFSRLLLERFHVTPSSAPSTVRAQMATLVQASLQEDDAIAAAATTHLLGHVAGIPFPDSPYLTPLRKTPAELHQRACNAVARLVEGDGQTRPILVLLDNMHLAEREGWEVLRRLVRAEAHLAIVIAGESPIAERALSLAPAGGVLVGPIDPLGEEDVSSMLYVIVPELKYAPEPLVAALTHRSGGNPSAVRDLVLALQEAGVFIAEEDGLRVDLALLDRGSLPITHEDAVHARLERLDALERATLDRAAVIGPLFWDWGILSQMRSERMIPGDESDPLSIWPEDEDANALHMALRQLEQRGFIEIAKDSELPGALECRFVHADVCRMIYAELPDVLRIRRHAAVARWFALSGQYRRATVAARIAPHLEKAGQEVRAGRAYLEAAGYDRDRSQTQAALRHVEKALQLLASDDFVRRIDALHLHGSLLSTVGRYDEAMDAFLEMLRLSWQIGARGKGGAALNRIARVHRERGDEESARRILGRALDLFRSCSDLRGVASCLDDLAQILMLRGELDAAARAAKEALEIRRAQGDRRGEALSLNTLGHVEIRRAHFEAAEASLRDALRIREEIIDRPGIIQSHNGLGILAFERSDFRTAVRSWEAALAEAREVADLRSQCFFLNNIGEAQLHLGDLSRARANLSAAQGLASALADKRSVAEVERNLGLVALRSGDDDAGKILRNALELAEVYGGRDSIAHAHRALGRFRAQALFDDAATNDTTAEQHFLMSIDMFREIGSEHEAARSLQALGMHLLERGESDTAVERLREARAIMRRIGLAELQAIEKALGELGAR